MVPIDIVNFTKKVNFFNNSNVLNKRLGILQDIELNLS
ncbi:hypothetical protein KIS1582_3183 [Cytobacillus firmus]|uniref:Uncharacterized protein n=1 Tax=Cytobacillus firmus TaxID=1399 RepID=A0A800MV62_CYTFI|nr:hypothetical protein KIS1582_3183 [Cytobacillus firmus]